MAQTDRAALVALYDATDGPYWKNKTHWGTHADLSDWYGVTANEQGRVVELSLGANNLRGILRPTLRHCVLCDQCQQYTGRNYLSLTVFDSPRPPRAPTRVGVGQDTRHIF